MANDPAVTSLIAQLDVLDGALAKVELHAPKAAEGVKEVGTAAETTATKTRGMVDGIRNAADTFNEVHAAALTVAASIASVVESVTSLTVEQGRLTASSAQMGLDFDEAAAAAGKFADETSAMQSASTFAAREIRLTQTELDALARVAGHAAEILGTTADEQMSDLTDALISGRERGLSPYGAALQATAGDSHTLAERLHALVATAGNVSLATDNAADRMARFRDAIDDAKRTIAAAAANEFMRLNDLSTPLSEAADSTERWNRNLTAIGQTVAHVIARATHGIGALVGLIGAGVGGVLASVNGVAQALAALTRGDWRTPGAIGRAGRAGFEEGLGWLARPSVGLLESSADVLEGIDRDSAGRTSADAGGAARPGAGATAADREARGADMTFTLAETRGGSRGGRGAPTEDLTDKFAKAVLDLATFRVRGTIAQELGITGATLLATPGEGNRGTVGDRLTGAQLRAQQGMLDVEGGNVGTGRTTQEGRIAVLREQRAALAELNDESERALEAARAAGAPQAEINRLATEHIGIATAQAQVTRELAAAQAEQSSALTEFRDKMVNALEGATTAFAGAIEAWASGSKTFGDAMEEMLRSTLSSLLKMAIVEALKNTAIGIGHLATYNYPGAAQAFAAVAAWGAVAVAAGAGTAAMAKPSASSGASAPSGTGSGAARADSGAARADRSQSGGSMVLNITVSGALFNDGVYEGIARGIREAGARGYDLGRLGA